MRKRRQRGERKRVGRETEREKEREGHRLLISRIKQEYNVNDGPPFHNIK